MRTPLLLTGLNSVLSRILTIHTSLPLQKVDLQLVRKDKWGTPIPKHLSPEPHAQPRTTI